MVPETTRGVMNAITVVDFQRTVTSTTYTITTLDSAALVAGTTYDVRVSAKNAVGIGDWSEVVSARVPSTDAALRSLTVNPVDISEFRAETTSYSLTVGSTVTQVTVYYHSRGYERYGGIQILQSTPIC